MIGRQSRRGPAYRSPAYRGPAYRGVIGLALAVVSIAACNPQDSSPGAGAANAGDLQQGLRPPLLEVAPEILFPEPILVVPGTRWDNDPPAGDRWRFRTFAKILCVVRDAGEEALRVGLRPDRATSRFDFKISWDGAELDSPRQEAGLWWIEIPPERLAPGRHDLTLRRVHRPPTAAERRARAKIVHDNRFHDLRHVHGGRETILGPEQADRQRLIAEFLSHGVLGRDQERRDGLLFAAVDRHRLALPEAIRRVRFEPENYSDQAARFRFALGDRQAEVEIGPGERGVLELDASDLGNGARDLELEVEGEAGGLYLWGMPIAERKAAADGLGPVILITLDTTRRDALSPYSGRDEVTPVIARLAEQATVFEQAFSSAPWTLPSHASIFTGLYPSKHGAGVSQVQLPAGTETLARLLRRRGYLTAGFSAGERSSSRFGLAQGFHHYRNPDQFETPGDRVAQYVGDFLESYASHPLFLFINYFDPHAVFKAPAEFTERLGVAARGEKIRQLPVWGDLLAGEMSSWRLAVEGEAPITPEAVDYLESAYLAEVAYTDHLLGRLFGQLEDLGLFHPTLIIITADHGELLGEGGYVSHAARLDPELVEIPLIIKWPGQRKGERVEGLVSLVDLFPTVLAAAGIEPPASDGRNLAPGAGDGRDRRTFVLLEEHEFLVHPLPKNMKVAHHLFGVQRPGFRQLVWKDGAECARLRDGEWQETDCSAERERVLRSIQAELRVEDRTPEDGQTPDGRTPDGPLSDEMRQSLEALGYL